MKHNVGILIFGDPTRGGTISSETKFLANLYDKSSEDSDFYIITINPSVTKRVIRDRKVAYDFPHKVITIFGEEDFHKLDSFSCIVTYPGHSNFFGGYLNDNIVKMYKIVSKCTHELNIPVFVRVNDSEIKVRDYRKMSEVRLIDGETKPESAFMKDPGNVAKARDIVAWKEWDYSKVYWFANGSKSACDWVSETLFDREDVNFRMATKQQFIDNTIYVSDDIFFLVRKNYDRFESRYEHRSGETKQIAEEHNRFCYIGFFDTVNVARAKAFNVLFKENRQQVPLKIFGKGTEILTKFKDKPNVNIEEGFIKGDSEEYFDFLHNHLAYLFIGKGQSESRYIGKTVYDAVVARTPVAVYKKCDSKMITFENPEFYFEDERELKVIFDKLQDHEIREKWMVEQYHDIMRKLPPMEFSFAKYCKVMESISEDILYTPIETSKPPKKEKKAKEIVEAIVTPKSIALF
jgi:hypothetical protein